MPTAEGTLSMIGGVALPDRRLTPGAVFASATAAQVCVSGYSSSVRDVSEGTREAVFAEYRISFPPAPGTYEVDHLIPLELGGSNDVRNLWPQPDSGAMPGFPSKDRLENALHEMVCNGQLPLAVAQQAIATNWYAAFQRYIGGPAAAPAPPQQAPAPVPPQQAPVPAQTTSSAPAVPVVHPGAFCAPAGARGVTSAGTPMVCGPASDGRNRWHSG